MLKVAPCTVGRTVVRSVVRSYGRTVVRSYGRTVVRSNIQIFSARWVTTILYNYEATLCELHYYLEQSSCQSSFAVKSVMHITNTVAHKQNREAFATGVSTAKTVCTEFERSLLRLKDQFIKFPKTRQEL